MKDYEKLDFLMNVTKTSNSALSMSINLDSSHISRLRRGERHLVRDAEYMRKMAAYFLNQCHEEIQKNTLAEVIQIPREMLDDPQRGEQALHDWMVRDRRNDPVSVAHFLKKFEEYHSPQEKTGSARTNGETGPEISVYQGYEGKREAVRRLLSMVLQESGPQELLLFSDESMDWLALDAAFQKQWMGFLSEVIARGNRIKIIHTVSRNLDEMLEALSHWLPLYMTGAIEPFYYPRKRDGIFKRTLFIAPHTAAISANSLDAMAPEAVSVLMKEKKAVAGMVKEFEAYLALCRPLMRILTKEDRISYIDVVTAFEGEMENTLIKSHGLSLWHLPEQLVRTHSEESDILHQEELLTFARRRKENYLKNLETRLVREIIHLEAIDKVREGGVPLGYDGILEIISGTYRPEEYRQHLKTVVHLLKTYENYQVILTDQVENMEYRILVKENLGVIVEKITPPRVAFVIKEGNLIAAFWDYLNLLHREQEKSKAEVIALLEAFIEEI